MSTAEVGETFRRYGRCEMLKKLLIFASVLMVTCDEIKPNFVVVLTDDQDVLLGGLTPMKNLRRLIAKKGISFRNAYATTPICCPSRSSILTGLYVHHHGTKNNSVHGGCNSRRWRKIFERRTFASLMHKEGYRTFYAGKYLNQYGRKDTGGTDYVPEGWDWWIGLAGNSVYYNYTLSVNGSGVFRGENEEDYLTDVLSGYGLEFLKNSHSPFLMVISTPSPHEPFTPAPRHVGMFSGLKAPRTPNFNMPGKTKTKHWLLRLLPESLSQNVIQKIDGVFRNRWETLLAVDEMIEAIIKNLKESKLLGRTYVIFTSDNGFHMGQFALPWDKRQPYETDIKIPMLMTGPGMPKNRVSDLPVLNIDLAPTILRLAGIDYSVKMDGTPFWPKVNEMTMARNFLVEYHGEGGDGEPCYIDDNLKLCSAAVDCKCFDSRNNTYHCIRRFGDNLSEIYCKFKDREHFRELYDLRRDPHQMINLVPKVKSEYLRSYDKVIECCESLGAVADISSCLNIKFPQYEFGN